MSSVLALAMQVAAQPSYSRPEMSQARLNAMADACHVPREWVKLRGRDVVFRPDPVEDIGKLDYVLRQISAATDMKNIVFIGNEQASEDK